MDFSPVSNIMNNENVNDEDRDESGEFFGTVATARERISFNSIVRKMRDNRKKKFIASPDIIVQAVLLGPLDHNTLERFLQDHNEEFIQKTKELLFEMETWDEAKYDKAICTKVHNATHLPLTFEGFQISLQDLMNSLRDTETKREPRRMSYEWARKSLQIGLKRLFLEKCLLPEQFHDIAHSALVQHPQLKCTFLKFFALPEYKQVKSNERFIHEYEKWVKFDPYDQTRTEINNHYSGITSDLYKEIPGLLSIPADVKVHFIDSLEGAIAMEVDIFGRFVTESHLVVGIDSEWDPFVHNYDYRSSILQIALHDVIYILDLNAIDREISFNEILSRFWSDKRILKFGYQFAEDLVCLRRALPRCVGLFQPAHIICIENIVNYLQRMSLQKGFDMEEYFPSEVEDNNAKKYQKFNFMKRTAKATTSRTLPEEIAPLSSNDDSPPQEIKEPVNNHEPYVNDDLLSYPYLTYPENENHIHEERGNVIVPKHSRKFEPVGKIGLSNLSMRMLGGGLDKREQCSVWDRRPLRDLQLRYAALDAFCLIKIYERCLDWSNALGIFLYTILIDQPQMHAPLPLFIEFK
uniref:3'-5' exonuclease domain-containing protein n=1 Tax=Acrobeloides nanus TaxID=290746 RepID=A0A914CMN6_9BILA